ncbi:LLM class flavin-dependent oxidoreductase [Yinghuangia soli]|uniref:LLM class flavin-dependent oxidoreductase n=1 Tax=Yinghuangia soli TaxID=2908204 RepID=A0AA41Q344_9ACTN|nr:LLM class flavin-dependent oxidoreductase [Yinghuangia soli]MCF2530665.1 LLM class flavin-dependent oxidoreductase [Yinghuangia soli]
MQFSMIFEAQMANPTAEHERQVILDSVEQAVYAEEMGFDRIWAVEHHSTKWYSHMSAPEIFLTWVAARTTKIRIAHGAVCMPFNFNHPARVAERIGMLDTLSGGRLDVGAARGGTLQETSLVGADMERTKAEVEEALRIIGAAWQKDELEYDGDLLKISPHPILPRPVQTPHPPLFLACSKQPSLVEAANMGVGALVLGFAGPEEVANLNKIYRDAVEARDGSQFVSTVQNNHLVALCPTIVAEDGAKARQIGARGQRFFAQSIAHWFSGGKSGIPDEAVVEGRDEVAVMNEAAEQQVAMLHEAKIPVTVNATATYNLNHAYGTAEDAIGYVQKLIDAGADEIMCLIQMGTVPQEACMETIRIWGEEVIPHFRKKYGSTLGA